MYSRLLKTSQNKSFFLFGGRGTGKTTWVRSNFPKSIYVDLLSAQTYNRLVADPSRLEEMIPVNYPDFIIIDEIQRVPQLLNEVHRLIELKKYKFIMTGSSARKLRRGGENLLAGRALTFFMHPLTAVELGSNFSLKKCLQFGSLPAIFSEGSEEQYLASYVQTYLQQEIIQEGVSRNLSAFARFLETASFSQGSVLNISEVAREAAVNRKVVEDYFSALEDMLTAVRLPVFSKRAKRRLISHHKFYFFDTGIYRTIRPLGPFDEPEKIGGIALESFFLQNLRAINDYLNLGYDLFYYRTPGGTEVDFVAYGKRGLRAFEIKSKKTVSPADLKGLKTFLHDYPLTKGYFLYGGKERRYFDNITAIPYDETLLSLPELLK